MWPLVVSDVLPIFASSHLTPEKNILPLNKDLLKEVVDGLTTDSRQVRTKDFFVAIRGEKFDGHVFVEKALNEGATLALVDTNWTGFEELSELHKERCIRVEDVVVSFRSFAAWFRTRLPFPVIAIGGSNGKTTTKEFLAASLSGQGRLVTRTRKSENGFLGCAMTLCSRQHRARAAVSSSSSSPSAPYALVLEIGIDEVGAMESHVRVVNPDFMLLTALGVEHLAGLGTWETAIAEEFKLFTTSRPAPGASRIWNLGDEALLAPRRLETIGQGDVLVIPKEQEAHILQILNGIDAVANVTKGEPDLPLPSRYVHVCLWNVKVSDATSSRVVLQMGLLKDGCYDMSVEQHDMDVPLAGRHNASNFALAYATARRMGCDEYDVEAGLSNFEAPPMRSAIEQLPNGCVLIDDCYNASPTSMEASLALLKASEWEQLHKVVVLGDMLDLGSESKLWHQKLVPLLSGFSNTDLCLFGTAMYDVYRELSSEEMQSGRASSLTVSFLPTEQNPALLIEHISSRLTAENVILVKGSRGMDLGRLVVKIRESCRT